MKERFCSIVENAGWTHITNGSGDVVPIRSVSLGDLVRAVLFVLGLAAVGVAAPYAYVAGGTGVAVGSVLMGGASIIASLTPSVNPDRAAQLQTELERLGFTLSDGLENLRSFVSDLLDSLESDGLNGINEALASFAITCTCGIASARLLFALAKWLSKDYVDFKSQGGSIEGDFTTKAELEALMTDIFKSAGLAGVNSTVTIEDPRWEGFYDASCFYNIFAYTYRGKWCYAVFRTTSAVDSYTYEVTQDNCRLPDDGYVPNSIALKLFDAEDNAILPSAYTNYYIGTYREGSRTGDRPLEVNQDYALVVNGFSNGQTAYGGWAKWGPGAGWWPYGIQDDVYSNINDIAAQFDVKWLYKNGERNDSIKAVLDPRVKAKIGTDEAVVVSGNDTVAAVDSKIGTGDKSFTMTIAPDALAPVRQAIKDAVEGASAQAKEFSEAITDGISTAIVDAGSSVKTLVIDPAIELPAVIADLTDAVIDLIPDGVIPEPPLPQTGAHDLFTIYKVSDSSLSAIASYLWANIISLESLQKLFNDPIDSMISLSQYPLIPQTSGSKQIMFGNAGVESGGSPVSGEVISQKIQDFSMGDVYINGSFGNFLDYSPYTKVRMFLPFVGLVELNTDDVMNRTLSVNYRVEFMTGSCLASIKVIGQGVNAVMYQYSGSVSMQLPLTARNYGEIYKSIVGAAASFGAAAITGGAGAGATAAQIRRAKNGLKAAGVSSAAGVVTGSKTNIQRSGSMQGNSGMLGGMKPYVVIERPVANMPSGYDGLIGRTSNAIVTIGSLSGYNELEEVNLSIVNATEEERAEIEQTLKTGFFV